MPLAQSPYRQIAAYHTQPQTDGTPKPPGNYVPHQDQQVRPARLQLPPQKDQISAFHARLFLLRRILRPKPVQAYENRPT